MEKKNLSPEFMVQEGLKGCAMAYCQWCFQSHWQLTVSEESHGYIQGARNFVLERSILIYILKNARWEEEKQEWHSRNVEQQGLPRERCSTASVYGWGDEGKGRDQMSQEREAVAESTWRACHLQEVGWTLSCGQWAGMDGTALQIPPRSLIASESLSLQIHGNLFSFPGLPFLAPPMVPKAEAANLNCH